MAQIKVKAVVALRYRGQRHPAGAELAMEQAHIDALPKGAVELVTAPPANSSAEKQKETSA